MTALELDVAKVRVMKSAQKQTGMFAKKKGSFMKSRVALVAVLALGVFMSGTGATLAVSGFANNGSASSAQYPQEHNGGGKKPHHIVEGATASGGKCTEGNGGNSGSGAGGNGSGDCTDATPAATTPVEAQVETQAVEQVAVTGSSSSLPFTGFLAVPVLIIGLGLLGAGVAMRVRNRRGDHVA
jgi:hypothetical protein